MTDLQVASEADIPEVQRLFREYSAWVGVDLSFQDFDRELAQLPGDYVPPAVSCSLHEWTEGLPGASRLIGGERTSVR